MLANWIHECDMLGGSNQTTQHRGSVHMRRGTGGLRKTLQIAQLSSRGQNNQDLVNHQTYCHTCHVFFKFLLFRFVGRFLDLFGSPSQGSGSPRDLKAALSKLEQLGGPEDRNI